MALTPYPIPTITVRAGTELHRVHRSGDGALFYGKKDRGWRFDDPARSYGLLYVGEDPVAAFAETLLRWPATRRDVLWSDVEARRFALFRTTRDLTLAKLHGSGVSAFGIKPSELTGEDYGECQAISAIVHGDPGCDGIRYRSRFENDLHCLAVFDRADDAIELVGEGRLIDRNWTFDVLAEHRYNLLDL